MIELKPLQEEETRKISLSPHLHVHTSMKGHVSATAKRQLSTKQEVGSHQELNLQAP